MSQSPMATPVAVERPRSAKRFPTWPILALVALLVGGGLGYGGYLAMAALNGGGAQPADALPGSTMAYVRVDLDPAARQKVAAFRLVDKAPRELRDALNSDDIKKAIFERLQDEESMPQELRDMSYDNEIAPWLGDRIGVGVMDGNEDEPLVAVAMQIKDADKAKTWMDKNLDVVPVYVEGDYLVMSDTKEHLTTIQDANKAGKLSTVENFKQDMQAVGDAGIMSFWVDTPNLADPLTEYSKSVLGATERDAVVHESDSTKEAMKKSGRMAGALRFTADHVELVTHTRGATQGITMGKESASGLKDLPSDAVVGMSGSYPQDEFSRAWQQALDTAPEDTREMMKDSVEEGASAIGIKFPEDISTLLGTGMTLSVGDMDFENLQDPSDVKAGLVFKADPGNAEAVVKKIRDAAADAGEQLPIVTGGADGRFYVSVTDSYRDEMMKPKETLGNLDVFKQAVPESETAQMQMFVNLNALEDLYLDQIEEQDARAVIGMLRAIGVSMVDEGKGNYTTTLRITLD